MQILIIKNLLFLYLLRSGKESKKRKQFLTCCYVCKCLFLHIVNWSIISFSSKILR